MGKDGDRVDVWVFDQSLQHHLERVARIDGAVAIIDVVSHIAAGRPSEQHGRDIDPCVMNNLRETIDGFLETSVEAVDEDEDPAARNPPDARIEIGLCLSQVHAIGAKDGEVTLRIGGQRGWERDIPRLAGAGRRDRHDDIGEIESSPPRASEHDARGLSHRGACRRDKEVDPARVRRAGSNDECPVGTAGAACGGRRQGDHTEYADSKSRRCSCPRRA